jgi:hypothetical protein
MQRHEHHQDEVDQRFDELFAQCWEEYLGKQEAFATLLAQFRRWQYDHETCTLTLKSLLKRRSFQYTPIGTYLPESRNWCWAWANDALPELARKKSLKIKSLADETQYQIFASPWFELPVDEIDEFCALALHVVKGIGIFKSKGGSPWAFLAVE